MQLHEIAWKDKLPLRMNPLEQTIANLSRDQLVLILDKSIDHIKFNYKKGTKLTQLDIAVSIGKENYDISRAKDPKTTRDLRNCKNLIFSIFEKYNLICDDLNSPTPNFKFGDEEVEHIDEKYFVYYHVAKDFSIQKGKLVINGKQVVLTLYNLHSSNTPTIYTGEKIVFPDQFFFVFNERTSIKKKREKITIPACNCFSGSLSNDDTRIFVGTFAAAGPSCGVIALLKSNEGEIDNRMLSKEIEAEILQRLYNKRFDVGTSLLEQEENNEEILIEKISQLTGTYEAYLVESDSKQEFIHKLKFLIEKDGKIKFESKISFEQNGLIVDTVNSIFIALFKYNKKIGYYSIQIMINSDFVDHKNVGNNEYLIGTYSGLEVDYTPMAGRILFRKVQDEYDEMNVSKTYLRSKADVVPLFTEQPLLYNFIRGELDAYVDSPVLLEKYKSILSRNLTENRTVLKTLAGNYNLFHLASNEEFINRMPVEILEDGTVKIKYILPDNSGCVFHGYAQVFGSFLSIYTTLKDEQPWFVHFLFSVGWHGTHSNHFMGVSSSLTSNGNPRCGREILIKVKKNDESKLIAERVPIPIFGRNNNAFEELNRQYEGLANFLVGNSNNLIKSPRDVDAKFERIEDYGELYFYAACYQAYKHESAESILNQLSRAFKHGFGLRNYSQKESLENEMNNGVLNMPEIFNRIDLEKLSIITK